MKSKLSDIIQNLLKCEINLPKQIPTLIKNTALNPQRRVIKNFNQFQRLYPRQQKHLALPVHRAYHYRALLNQKYQPSTFEF